MVEARLNVDTTHGVAAMNNFTQASHRAKDAIVNMGSAGSSSMMTLSRMAFYGMSIWDRYEIATLAVENAQQRVTMSQERLQDAIERYGAGSKEAVRAQQELEISTNGVDIAMRRQQIRMLFGAFVILPEMTKGISSLIKMLTGYTAATNTATIAQNAFNLAKVKALALTPGVGWALLAGAAVAAGIGGAALGYSMGGGSQTNVYPNNIVFQAPRSAEEFNTQLQLRRELETRREIAP